MAHESIFGSAIASETIVVKCAGKKFIYLISATATTTRPSFLSINEDPVVVTLTDDERQQLESLRARSNECG